MPQTEAQTFDSSTSAQEHLLATLGSLTERGGHITQVSTQLAICGHLVARVGDTVTYADGSTATIIDGAGSAFLYLDRPVALVGSHLSNGDRIIETQQSRCGIPADRQIPGLFDPAWVHVPDTQE